MTDATLIDKLKEFIENEMRSCSMDICGITPEYVQRAWGGRVAIEDIEAAFEELKRSENSENDTRKVLKAC